MISIYLFIIAAIFTLGHLAYKRKWGWPESGEIFLAYFLFFTMGVMGILAAYAHVFMGPEIAKQIGWAAGSPFQFEMGMANLSYGVLGLLAYWIRGRFWAAAIIGWSILLLGCFVGHLIDYFVHGNTAPFNIGIHIWLYDLVFPIIALITFFAIKQSHRGTSKP